MVSVECNKKSESTLWSCDAAVIFRLLSQNECVEHFCSSEVFYSFIVIINTKSDPDAAEELSILTSVATNGKYLGTLWYHNVLDKKHFCLHSVQVSSAFYYQDRSRRIRPWQLDMLWEWQRLGHRRSTAVPLPGSYIMSRGRCAFIQLS